MDPEKPLFIIATGCSCLDIISSFVFSWNKTQNNGPHTWLWCSYMLLFIFRTTLYMYIHTRAFFMPKTMDLFMLGRADNEISITQIPWGFRWQEALFMEEDIWVWGTYTAHAEVQWEQEITFLYPLCFATQRAQKWSKYQPLCESKLVICLALLAEIQGQKSLGPGL